VSGRVVAIFIAGLLVLSGVGLAIYVLERPTSAPAADGPVAPGALSEEPAAPEDTPRLSRPAPPPDPPAEPVTSPAPVDAAPTTGSLRIVSDVPDTSVFVNREFLGTAPVTKADLPPGPHTVQLSPIGYEFVTEVAEVAAGEEREVSVSFKTIRLDAAIAVVHKHTFGSCEGTLRASPEGLAYETSNEKDGFTVEFADLETFEVDYLDTNLRVKIRNGKTYNFTDSEGNADPLFVFHRDVEKVRQRGAGGQALTIAGPMPARGQGPVPN
jgi:hypothetical protein